MKAGRARRPRIVARTGEVRPRAMRGLLSPAWRRGRIRKLALVFLLPLPEFLPERRVAELRRVEAELDHARLRIEHGVVDGAVGVVTRVAFVGPVADFGHEVIELFARDGFLIHVARELVVDVVDVFFRHFAHPRAPVELIEEQIDLVQVVAAVDAVRDQGDELGDEIVLPVLRRFAFLHGDPDGNDDDGQDDGETE